MGLLDDAIRDHLDLKRRRGADPAEVERAEREALGPVRRGPEALADADPLADDETMLYDDAAPAGAEPAREAAPAAPAAAEAYDEDEDLYLEDDDEWLEEEEHPPLAFEGSAAAPSPGSAGSADQPPPEPEPDPAPRPATIPEPHPAPPARSTGEETVEYRVEDALAAERAPGREEDVLEETPEFLQDTPDHDRLWFEQRPPRDFDFDG